MIPLRERSHKFKKFFQCCLGLRMVRERELESCLKELSEVEMEDLELNEAKKVLLNYLENEWMYGSYPPSVWNCFGRIEDCTNNALESFNGILNRLILVFHPNPSILISYLIAEMITTEVKVDRMNSSGKKQKVVKNKYAKLLEETQSMKDQYILGFYKTKIEYLAAIRHKIVRINEELRGAVENLPKDAPPAAFGPPAASVLLLTVQAVLN